MKNIKFRFVNKHKETGEIRFVYTSVDELESEDSWQGRVNYKRIAQNLFTGLLDKRGKEIYDGDILKEYWKPCEDTAAVAGEYIGEVFYEDAGYWTRSKNHHHAITEACDSYEVIGNIYQNPELIPNFNLSP